MNIGCGRTPTPGWLNFDNSASVRFAKQSNRPLFFNQAHNHYLQLAAERGIVLSVRK